MAYTNSNYNLARSEYDGKRHSCSPRRCNRQLRYIKFAIVVFLLFIVLLAFTTTSSSSELSQYHESNSVWDDKLAIPLHGFKTCTHLEGSTLKHGVSIQRFKTTTSQLSAAAIVRLIDWEAEQIVDEFYRTDHGFQEPYKENIKTSTLHDYVVRFGCYQGMIGNGWTNWTRDSMLQKLDVEKYFTNVYGPFTNSSSSPSVRDKPRYKLAFVLLIHGSSVATLPQLLSRISTPSTVILIHIDAKSAHLREEIIPYLAENILLLPYSHAVHWAHVSMVHVQLYSYFYLLDHFNVDWVINLSGLSTYLLLDVDAIMDQLELTGESIWVSAQRSPDSMTRLKRPFFAAPNPTESLRWFNRTTTSPAFLKQDFGKQSQWMILPVSFLQFLRKSRQAQELLAFMEFTEVPDEHYFIHIILNSRWKNKLINTNKHMILWDGESAHPITFSLHNTDFIEERYRGNWFIRKVDLDDHDFRAYLDTLRDNETRVWWKLRAKLSQRELKLVARNTSKSALM